MSPNYTKYYQFTTMSSIKNAIKTYAILLLGIVFTVALTLYTKNDIDNQSKKEYTEDCNVIKLNIISRLHSHAQLLRTGSAFFESSDTVTRTEWAKFNEQTHINKNLPGIQGVGFSIIVPKNQLNEHIQKIRKDGFPDYSIKPAGDREFYTSIIYLEPFTERNLRAFGFDMYSESIRRKAMELARDSDLACLSGKVILVQETNHNIQAGTLMYVPVYNNKMPTQTIEQRRAAIIGWVYSPYRMNDLMQGILGRWDFINKDRIHLQVYDQILSRKAILFDSQPSDTINHDDAESRKIALPIDFNGTKWVLLFTQNSNQVATFSSKMLIVFFCGLAISFLLFFLSITIDNTRYRAQQIADKLTTDLKQSESLFSLFMDYLPAIVFMKDNAGKTLFVNKFMDKAVGASQWLGKTMTEVFPNDFGKKLLDDDKNVIKLGYQKIDESIVQLDGKLHSYETQKFIIPRLDQEPYLGGVSLDITERKLSEDLLQQTRQNYETFFNTIDDFLFVLDEKGQIIHMNNTVISRLGYTRQELLGQSFLMIHPPERRDEANRIVGEMLTGKAEYCPVPIMTKSGIQIAVETKIAPGTWDGKPVIFGVTKDISQIKLSEEKFSKAFHSNSAVMSLTIFESGKFIDVNDTFLREFGYSRNEVIGFTSQELGIFVDSEARLKLIEFSEHGKNEIEIEIQTKNKTQKFGLFSAEKIYIANELCLLTTMIDITYRKEAEQIIKSQNLELQKADNDKNRFISILAHDLKNPFSALLGFSELLLTNVRNYSIEKIEMQLEVVFSSAKSIYQLLDELLLWARAQADKLPFSPEYLNFQLICEDVINSLSILANAKNIKVIHFSSNEIFLFADENMFKTILRNLITNAIKFTKVDGTIEIYAFQESNQITITVSDNGIGISPEKITKLFDISQIHSSTGTAQEKGTGLGLILCKDLVEKHGGKIWLESELNKGSNFSFSLPFG